MMSSPARDLLESFLTDHPEVPGALVHVDAPGLDWTDAAGVREFATREPLQPEATVRIASITKTYVAAAILRLSEQGRLGLEDPIGRHLEGELADLLGTRRCERILLHHLLTHTSGVCDFVEDTDYLQVLLADPRHRWTRGEQVQFAMERCEDVGEPGAQFHYSDTGFVVLGAVIERTTGVGLAESLRSLLRFDALGFSTTYLESLEPKPPDAAARAHQYVAGHDMYDHDPSFDLWGGGGLVSSMTDVAGFYRALFKGRVYDRRETLGRMIEIAIVSEGAQIGMGIAGRVFDGHTIYGHGGYWGLYAGFIPDVDAALAVSVQDHAALPALAMELLPALITTIAREVQTSANA